MMILPPGCMEIKASIKKVAITEDEAHIHRETVLNWQEGPVSFFIKNVTPSLIDRTLRAEVICKDIEVKLDIGSVRCIRSLVREEKLNEKKILSDLERIYKKLYSLAHRKERLFGLRLSTESTCSPAIEQIMEEVLLHGAMPDKYRAQMDIFLEETDNYYLENHRIEEEEYAYLRELEEIKQTVAFNPALLNKEAGILITMEASKAGTGVLGCGYQVPCSQWRPQHEAHLLSDGRIRLITQGVVWQNTGEDWEDVEILLSTAKPGQGLDMELPPQDFLFLRKKTPQERKRIEVQMRDRVVSKTGVTEKEVGEPPLPSDGGETRVYRVPEKVKILATGKPHILELEKSEMKGEAELIAIPELDSRVYLRSLTKNTGERPLLAGPVTLHREGTSVGKGELEFTGSNEDFYLWWGSEDLIKIERSVKTKDDKATLMQNRKVQYTTLLYIHNLTGEEKTFKLQERIPVSEIEGIRISVKELPEKAKDPDKDGFIFIPVSINAGEEKKLVISYVMDIDKEVNYHV